MEKLRTILYAVMALVLSVGFVSCSDDDEPADGASNVGRKLISIYEPKYGEYEYLDPVWENGKLVSYIDGIDEADRMSIVYLDNNKASVKGSADGKPWIITLDANGHMTEGLNMEITYNSDGQMVGYTSDYCTMQMDYSGVMPLNTRKIIQIIIMFGLGRKVFSLFIPIQKYPLQSRIKVEY